jgi:hypothetical protein
LHRRSRQPQPACWRWLEGEREAIGRGGEPQGGWEDSSESSPGLVRIETLRCRRTAKGAFFGRQPWPREKRGRGGRKPNGQSGKPRRGEGQESIGFFWGLTALRGERTLGRSNALESGFTPARASFERALTEPRAAFVGVVQYASEDVATARRIVLVACFRRDAADVVGAPSGLHGKGVGPAFEEVEARSSWGEPGRSLARGGANRTAREPRAPRGATADRVGKALKAKIPGAEVA